MRTTFSSTSGFQFRVTSTSPGKICHLEPSDSSTKWLSECFVILIGIPRLSDFVGLIALFHSTSLEESGVGGVLFDVGGIALLGRVLHAVRALRCVALGLCIQLRPLGALVARWDWRHFAQSNAPC